MTLTEKYIRILPYLIALFIVVIISYSMGWGFYKVVLRVTEMMICIPLVHDMWEEINRG